MVDQNGFFIFEAFSKNGNSKHVTTIDIPVVSGVFNLRTYQEPVFQQLRGKPRFIMSCPTGWGKTKMLQFLAVDALQNTNRKILVTVPQRIIASGFAHDCVLNLGGVDHNWGSVFSCCNNVDGKNVRMISKFLAADSHTTEGNICITTHSALTRLFTENPSELLRDDLTLIVDECHHISLGDDGDDSGNMLGGVINAMLQTKSWMWLTSATYGRADYGEIISEQYLKSFEACHVSFDEYWSILQHLREFSHRYVFYDVAQKQAYREILPKILDQRKTLVYLPQERSRFLFEWRKAAMVEDIIKVLMSIEPEAYVWTPRCKKPHAIIDLVTDTDRDAKIKFLYSHGDAVGAVLAVSMMREGADWPMLEHVVDLAPVFASMPLRIQKFGRGTRDYPNKHAFVYTTVLPRLASDDAEHATRCNEYFGQLIMGLVDAMYYSPSKFWPTGHVPKLSEIRDISGSIFDNMAAYCELEEQGVSDANEQFCQSVEETCDGRADSQMVLKYLEDHARSILSQLSLESLGFNKIVEGGIVGAFKSFCTEVCGLDTFREMREKLDNSTHIEWLKMLAELKSNVDVAHEYLRPL